MTFIILFWSFMKCSAKANRYGNRLVFCSYEIWRISQISCEIHLISSNPPNFIRNLPDFMWNPPNFMKSVWFHVKSNLILWNPPDFMKSAWFHEISLISCEIHLISWNYLLSHEIHQVSWNLPGFIWNSVHFSQILWISLNLPDFIWNSTDLLEVCLISYKIQWNPLMSCRFHKVPWYPVDFRKFCRF